jgi:hypothetical protein
MSLATAYVVYDGTSGTYEGGLKTISINCDRLRAYSPRVAWLKRRLMPGDGTQIQYLPTFETNDPEVDINSIRCFAIEVDGQDTFIDIASMDALTNACNCPDCNSPNGNVITRLYTSGIPQFVPPTLNTFCLTRLDDGSLYAHRKVTMDYTGRYIGNMTMTSHNSNTSIYTFQSFYSLAQLTPVLADVIVAC